MLRPQRCFATASLSRTLPCTAVPAPNLPNRLSVKAMQLVPPRAIALVPSQPSGNAHRVRAQSADAISRIRDASRRSSASPSSAPEENNAPTVPGFFASKGYEQLIRISQAAYIRLLMRSRFLRGVCKRAFEDAPNKDFEPFRRQVHEIQQELTKQNMRFSFMKPDAKNHLFVATLVLATYRALLERMPEEAKAIEVVQGAFIEQFDVFYNVLVPMYITKKDDDLIQLEGALKTHTRVMGDSFDVTFVRTPSGFSANVRRCFFNDFMEANRSSFLMGPVFCTADNLWKAVLPPSKHIQYKRPSTLAAGGKSCHFIFKCKETVEEKDKDKGAQQLRLGFS